MENLPQPCPERREIEPQPRGLALAVRRVDLDGLGDRIDDPCFLGAQCQIGPALGAQGVGVVGRGRDFHAEARGRSKDAALAVLLEERILGSEDVRDDRRAVRTPDALLSPTRAAQPAFKFCSEAKLRPRMRSAYRTRHDVSIVFSSQWPIPWK